MQPKKNTAQKLLLICKGIAMGVANKIPGVSGGVVALAAGFYEELIASFSKFNKPALQLLLNKEFKAFYTHVNGSFLTLLFSGVVLSFFSASLLLDQFIQAYPQQVWGLFFGMILASVLFIWIQAERFTAKEYLLTLIGTACGLAIAFLTPEQENDNLIFVFFCGVISISGMILPGLSGSFLILVLGNYTLLLIDSVNALYFTLTDLLFLDFSFLENSERINLLGVMFIFTLGSIAGLLILPKILNWFLKHHPKQIVALLIGFILGSLGALWPWKEVTYTPGVEAQIESLYLFLPKLNDVENIYTILFLFLGFGMVTLLELYGRTKADK